MFECIFLDVGGVGIIMVVDATNDVGVLGGIDRIVFLLDIGRGRVGVILAARRLFLLFGPCTCSQRKYSQRSVCRKSNSVNKSL